MVSEHIENGMMLCPHCKKGYAFFTCPYCGKNIWDEVNTKIKED